MGLLLCAPVVLYRICQYVPCRREGLSLFSSLKMLSDTATNRLLFSVVCTSLVCLKMQRIDEKTLAYRKPTHKFSSTPEKSPSQHDDDDPPEEAAPDINASNQTLGSNENNSFQNSLTQGWQRRKQFADDNPRTIQVRNQAIMYLAAFCRPDPFLFHGQPHSSRNAQRTNRLRSMSSSAST